MTTFSVILGDITKLNNVQAIVNAANRDLIPGGGVCGAIYAAAGDKLHKETSRFGGCPTGFAKWSYAYDLPCKYVIHTVAPMWNKSEIAASSMLLFLCYINTIAVASSLHVNDIAFPCIGTGVYGIPSNVASGIAVSACKYWDVMDSITFCCYTEKDYEIYTQLLNDS